MLVILKNLRLRRIFSGKSISIIKNGVIDQRAMRNVRMTVFDLVEMLRMQGIFELDDVESAILEVNGNLSVRPKPERAPVTPEQLKICVSDSGIPMTVISDGTVVTSSLNFLNLTADDLKIILKNQKVDPKDIFLMTLNSEGESIIIKKEQKL